MTKKILYGALKKYFGFDSFKENQEEIIQKLLGGKDVFVLMPTGGGKSMCYQLPALLLEGTAIVISPLIALMKNQVDAIRTTSEVDGIAHFINSSLTKAQVEQVKSDILSGRTKLLYVAPESLTKQENINFLIADDGLPLVVGRDIDKGVSHASGGMQDEFLIIPDIDQPGFGKLDGKELAIGIQIVD